MSEAEQYKKDESHKLNKGEMKILLVLAGVYITRMLGLFMILPVFALYAKNLSFVTPVLVGLAIGVYGLAQACLQIPLGMLSDRIGRKKVIVSGLLLFVLGSLIAGSTDNIYWIVLGRLLQGGGAIASTVMALVSDLTRSEVRTKAMAIVGASIGAAFLLALILGPLFYGLVGVNGIFYISAFLALIAIVLVLVFIPSKVLQVEPVSDVYRPSLFELVKDRKLVELSFGVLVLHWILTSSFMVLPILILDTYTISVDKHAVFYAGVFLSSFVVMWPLLKYFDRSSTALSVLVVFILLTTQFFWFYFDQSILFFLLTFILFFVAFNALEASMPSKLSQHVSSLSKGAAMGVYTSCQFMGAFLGGVLGGLVLQKYGLKDLFLLNALLCFFWLIISLYGAKKKVLVR